MQSGPRMLRGPSAQIESLLTTGWAAQSGSAIRVDGPGVDVLSSWVRSPSRSCLLDRHTGSWRQKSLSALNLRVLIGSIRRFFESFGFEGKQDSNENWLSKPLKIFKILFSKQLPYICRSLTNRCALRMDRSSYRVVLLVGSIVLTSSLFVDVRL